MTTRKVKDAKDLSTDELIYFKGHAKATYMSDGTTVEDAIPTKVSQLTNDSGYITSVAKGTATTQATAQTLMCDVNINGKTVTPVKFNGTVGSSTMPVYMAGGKPTPISSFPEAYLSWGGKNLTSTYGPIDAALVDTLRANRFDGLPAECITVEYSRDGGATWVDYEPTDKKKGDLVSQTADNAGLTVGKSTVSLPADANSRLRIIVNSIKSESATSASIYTALRKFALYITTNGSQGSNCTIKWRKQSDYAAGNDVWTVAAESVPIGGWSGYNVINTSNITTGRGDDHARQIAFEFSISSHDVGANGSYDGMRVEKLFAYGGVGWTTPSNMAARGHLYSYDYQQNAKFPAKVDAIGGLRENGTNLSSKYLGINATANSAKSISDGTNSYTPSAIKTMETNLEDVISDVVSIDTSLFPTSTDEVIGFRQTNGGDGVGYSEAWLDRLKGNTVVWNQLADTPKFKAYSGAASNITVVNDGKKITVTNTAYEGMGGDRISVSTTSKKTAIGHKILVSLNATFSNSAHYVLIEYGAYSTEIRDGNNDGSYETIYTTSRESTTMLFKAAGQMAIGDTWTFSNIKVVDLTQMFGAGNEPTTIEEFNARKPLGVTNDYNEGELISTTADEIKSVGFNAWDEQWEVGFFGPTGEWSDSEIVSSKNAIPVIPGAVYYFKNGSGAPLYITYWGEAVSSGESHAAECLGRSLNVSDKSVTIPNSCRYIHFNCGTIYGTTYNHDICIHLVHTGTRNGQYEPYKEYRLPLPIKDIKDKDGNQLFPNGLLSAGTAYDEITATKAIKRIGVVDMGTLSYSMTFGVGDFYFTLPLSKLNPAASMLPNGVSSKYIASLHNTMPDQTVSQNVNGIAWVVRDTSYTSAASFKAAMSGVMFYYELAEPIEVDIDEWDRRYEVSDFGTEEVISDTPTAPLKADIIYEYNAKGRIEANERGIEELNDKIAEMNEYSITSDKVWSEDTPVDCTIGEVDNDAFLPDGIASVGGTSRISRMYVKCSTTDNSYSGELVSEYSDNCLIIGVKGYYELTAPNGTMLKRGYLGDSSVKVEQTGNIGYSFNFTALDMEEGMNVRVGAILEYIDIN